VASALDLGSRCISASDAASAREEQTARDVPLGDTPMDHRSIWKENEATRDHVSRFSSHPPPSLSSLPSCLGRERDRILSWPFENFQASRAKSLGDHARARARAVTLAIDKVDQAQLRPYSYNTSASARSPRVVLEEFPLSTNSSRAIRSARVGASARSLKIHGHFR